MEEENIIVNLVDPQTFEFQEYSTADESLLVVNELDTVFSQSMDYIEAYVYDNNKLQISSQVPFTNFSVIDDNVLLTPSEDLERLGFDVGSYYISYDFYRPRLGSTLNTQYYISEISSDRTEIRLDSTQIDNILLVSSSLEFISYRESAEYFVDFLLNFGNNQQVIANNIELDTEDEDNPTVLIKLYEPLPNEFELKSTCSVVEQISTPQSYNVIFPPLEINVDDFTYISGPNYNLSITNQSGTPGMDFSYDTLLSSDITSSTNQIKSLLNRKEIEISVNYEDYNDFVYFSSAYTRLQNFYHKVGVIQSASLQLGQITSATTGSVIYSASQASLSNIVTNTIENFDGYEYFLYFNSGSKFSYPKSNSEEPYLLYPTGSTETLTWLGSTDNSSAYYGGQALSASNYDEQNQDSLFYAIPEYLRSDPQNAKYELFVDMVGQHYDNIWLYTKNITTKFDTDNRLDYGISKDMVADAIRDFGIKLYSNNFNTNDLYVAFLGLTPSGSNFPFPYMTGSVVDGSGNLEIPSGFEYVDSMISASDDVIPLDDINKRLYKRIYHNIPYLLKTKGTVAGLRALITSYGIPDTILRIDEFGGKDRNNSQDWDLKQDFYNLALNATSTEFSSSFNLDTKWSANSNTPGSLQFRFKTEGIPSSSNTPTTQSFFVSDSTSVVALALEYNDSLLTKGTYSGSVESKFKNYGTLKFWPNAGVSPSNYASLYLPFWDGGWWSVQINRNSGAGTFDLFAANKSDENLLFTGSDTITADISKWVSSNQMYWAPNSVTSLAGTIYYPFTGSLQEVRYFTEPLSESRFFDYTMNPYSFEGNSPVNSAPDELAFRLSLGTMLKTGSFNQSIHPKVTGSFVLTASFNGQSTASFRTTPTWLNNIEDIYLDQTPSGMRNRITDKIQIEELILPEGDTLSGYRSIQQSSYVSESFTPNINYLEVAFSPQNQINDDIIGQLGYFNIGEYIGDPRLISSSDKSYPALDILRDAYFEKYITNYDVTDFIRLIKFFDNSLFKMIEDFTPVRTSLSSGVVIKQHLLERNRQRPAQVTSSFEQYSGSVTNLPKDYSTGSSDFPQYDFSGSSIYVFKGGTGGSFEPFNGLQTSISGSLGNGPDNRFYLTQSWSESFSNLSGSSPFPRTDQQEFYNGEFSGSNIPVGINDICSAYFKPSMKEYRYIPVFWSENGNNSTLPISANDFLAPENQPPAKYAWFWNNGSNVIYIKLSLETYNGLSITPFIQNVNWVSFSFNNPIDAGGNLIVPNTVQTFYLESIVLQPGDAAIPPGIGTALCYTIPEESSIVVSSNDGAFADFNFSASGDFQWHATQNTATDPNPVRDTGISASVPQGYFPLTSTYPTESFFRGWASSNFYTNGTYNAYDGELFDPLDNFNTGSHEKDNTDTTVLTGIDPASNFPWFMNAGVEGDGKNYVQIPSESFLDYANIPDTSIGPVATNNYFNIAFTSASSAATPAIQGVNYYYNSSNNAIYMSGSEYQNEDKDPTPLFSSSLLHKVSGTSQLSDTATSYTPLGQTSLIIPIDPARGQELFVYRGESATSVADTNAWRYNRYIHRAFKIYYLTETGSGQPSDPYAPFIPISSSIVSTGGGQGGAPIYNSFNGQLSYVDVAQGGVYPNEDGSQGVTGTATMLGSQTDITPDPTTGLTNRGDVQVYLNATGTAPSVSAVSGSFEVFNSLRQVKPFIFTSYKVTPPSQPVGGAQSSGSFVSISQSDGTPFAKLQMFQNQLPSISFNPCSLYVVKAASTDDLQIVYQSCANSGQQTQTIAANNFFAWCQDSLSTPLSPTGNIYLFDDAWSPNPLGVPVAGVVYGYRDSPVWQPYPSTPNVSSEGDGNCGIYVVNQQQSTRNANPFFYGTNTGQAQFVNNSTAPQTVAGVEIPYGALNDGLNTSSLGLTTGTHPFGDNFTFDMVFPPGSYIFTMSDFDTTSGQFSQGFTEFGLYTKYGDYSQYALEHLLGSGDNVYDFEYIDTTQQTQTVAITENATNYQDAKLGSPNVTTAGFQPNYVLTGSITNRYVDGTPILGSFKTKVVDAYVVYSSSASSSLDGAYLFDVVPNLTDIFITASVVVSSYTDTAASLYGNAIYGTSEYGGGNSGGGTTWTTASLKIYTGSVNNFPTEMPVIGDGNVIAQTSSNSLTHNAGERITLMKYIPAGTVSYNDVYKLALEVGSGSNASSVVVNSLVVTEYSMSFSSSFDVSDDPSIPANFDNDSNFALAYDCQPLLNNFSNGRINNRLQNVDYNSGTVVPSNWQQIIDFSASRASVPESNYTQLSSTIIRYTGKEAQGFAGIINEWSPSDKGTFGKLPIIEVARSYATYFKSIFDPYPVLNNKVQYDLQYIISQDGEIVQPKLSSTSLFNLQGTFDAWPISSSGVISLTSPDTNTLLPLQGEHQIKYIAKRPIPVLYSQESGLFPHMIPNNIDPALPETASITLIGSEPIDPTINPTFNNYTVSAVGENSVSANQSSFGPETFVAPQKTPSADGASTGPTRNVTASLNNTGTGVAVYDTLTGNLTIPITDGNTGWASENTAGLNQNTSQPYRLEFALSFDTTPLVYSIQTTNPNKSSNYNTTTDLGGIRVSLQKKNTYSSGTFSTVSPSLISNVIVTCENFYTNTGGGNDNTYTFIYNNQNYINQNDPNGITVAFNSTSIEQALIQAGRSANPIQTGGGLQKQRWTVKGSVNSSTQFKQGNQFRLQAAGNLVISPASQADPNLNPKFFPNAQQGSSFYNLQFIGLDSNPIEDPIAPFWGIGATSNILVCSSSALNKAYGRDFIQADLIYTASQNKDFPGGLEPYYTTFPSIQTPWSVNIGDEIRFQNNEDLNFTITNVTPPDQNTDQTTWQEGYPSLILEVDGLIPDSLENRYTGSLAGLEGRALDPLATQSLYQNDVDADVVPSYRTVIVESDKIFRGLDFFSLRRFVDDAGVIITNQNMPYVNPPQTGSSSGFMFPVYPTLPLKVSPDELLTTLRDNKLIE